MSSGGLRLFAITLVGVALYGCNLNSDGRSVGGNGGAGIGGSGIGGIGGSGIGGSGTGGGFAGAGGFVFDAGSAGVGGFGGMVGNCPLQQCMPLSNPGIAMGLLMACCTGDGLCGLAGPFLGGCLPVDALGRDDATCPDSTLIGMPLNGCCTVDGACGVNLDQLNLGCVEREQIAGSGFFDLGGQPIDIPCFSSLVDAGADDAGAEDAGDSLCVWAREGFCDPIALCHAEGGTPICECPSGYADLSPQGEHGRVCRDVNECLLGASVCDGGTCVNTAGSFSCE